MMKKISFAFALAFLFISIAEIHAQTKITLKGGLNLANMLVEDDVEKISTDNFTGFHAGGIFEFPITELFSVETGIFASKKGFKFEESDAFTSTKAELDAFYVDIPLNAKINLLTGEISVFAVAGPTLGIGVGGETSEKYTYGGITISETDDIKWGSDEDDILKRFDYGFLLGAGIGINSFVFSLSYEHGLANLATFTDDGATIKNKVIKFSVGFIISGNE